MTTPMYWTEAPAEQVAPIRAKIQDVLEMLDMVSRADMRRVRDMLLGAFHLLTPGAQYQQVSMAAMELQDVTDMLKFRHAPLVAGCIDSAACAAKSLLFNMDECLEA